MPLIFVMTLRLCQGRGKEKGEDCKKKERQRKSEKRKELIKTNRR